MKESWWAAARECYCNLRSVQDLPADGQTPHERRFNLPFEGPIIPFGEEVKFFPISSKDQGRVDQFAEPERHWYQTPRPSDDVEACRGIMGCALNADGSWTCGQLTVDTEDVKTMPPSEIHVKRLKSKEVDIQKRDTEFEFTNAVC